MTQSPVFRPATDRYLPPVLAFLTAVAVLWATHEWGLGVLREQFVSVQAAQALHDGATFEFFAAPFPAGPLWPLWLSGLLKTGYTVEFCARIWQAIAAALLVYVATRFYLRHIRSRAIVVATSVVFAGGVLTLAEAFTLSPVLTSVFLATCGTLALARFLLDEGLVTFTLSALLYSLAALLWIPATMLALGAALAILIGGRGVLARRFSGVVFFAAMAVVPAALAWFASGAFEVTIGIGGVLAAVSELTSFTMPASWPLWLRALLTVFVFFSLLLVYLTTRGPAGIGPALKRRELQVWILLSLLWPLVLFFFPFSSALLPLWLSLLVWPALGADSFHDFAPISKRLSGSGARLALGLCAVLLATPLWQSVVVAQSQYMIGSGLRGCEWQASPLVQTLRHDATTALYSDEPAILRYVLGRDVRPLPQDLGSLEHSAGRIAILGDHCPPSLCSADSAVHPTLVFTPTLTAREGLLYDIRLRPPEPALTVTDSLTHP